MIDKRYKICILLLYSYITINKIKLTRFVMLLKYKQIFLNIKLLICDVQTSDFFYVKDNIFELNSLNAETCNNENNRHDYLFN